MRGSQVVLPSALVFVMLASGGGLLGIGLTGRPPDLQARGALLGLSVAILGMSAFALGAVFARGSSVEKAPRSGERVPGHPPPPGGPQEAKFWLQRFLDAQQGRNVPTDHV